MSHLYPGDMHIPALRSAYAQGTLSPEALMHHIRESARQLDRYHIWTHLLSEDEQSVWLSALSEKSPDTHPLWGIPFAIKDNIDLAGVPTTAGCPAFACKPDRSAHVVQALIDAGAIPVGKASLDQFATGLNGTRAPQGPCRNAIHPDFISGGSSSGSAVALALGLASFSLGTDTAGSGRVPAAFNGLVGLKPSRGLLSTRGMVPACRSLDCMSILALDTADANLVMAVAETPDPDDPWQQPNPFANGPRQFGCHQGPLRLAVPAKAALQFFGDRHYQKAWEDSLARLQAGIPGLDLVEIDYGPFDETARLLYEGPWVAERYLAIQSLLEQRPETVLPVIRDIILPGKTLSATETFAALYRLQALKRVCQQALADVDALLTPTAGTCFTIEAMLADPIRKNSQLGYYTNFMNLLDMAALALPGMPAGNGLPFGLTLGAPALSDRWLLSIGQRLAALFQGTGAPNPAPSVPVAPARGDVIDVLVCGAHLEGLPLNWQLTERGAQLRRRTHTAPVYRMYALAGGPPSRPGLIMDSQEGAAIEVEIWSVPASAFGSFVAGIPAPLGIGKVLLADQTEVCGFICEPRGVEGAEEITHLGGWRAWLSRKTMPPSAPEGASRVSGTDPACVKAMCGQQNRA